MASDETIARAKTLIAAGEISKAWAVLAEVDSSGRPADPYALAAATVTAPNMSLFKAVVQGLWYTRADYSTVPLHQWNEVAKNQINNYISGMAIHPPIKLRNRKFLRKVARGRRYSQRLRRRPAHQPDRPLKRFHRQSISDLDGEHPLRQWRLRATQ